MNENQIENENQAATTILQDVKDEIISEAAAQRSENEIIDNQKISDALHEIADVMENHGLNLAEAAEIARIILLWCGFEINVNADKIKSGQDA